MTEVRTVGRVRVVRGAGRSDPRRGAGAAPDLSGSVLEHRYELQQLIGEGTFGRVYRARDGRLQRDVAVKLIKPWWVHDPGWARAFERETQLLARVSDPGIVQIFDVGRAPEGLYYVAELVDGESLADRLRRGPLPAAQACDIAEQLSRALGRAHAQHVVHRDIKPANVLISSGGQVKLGDFGVARLAEDGTEGSSSAMIAGTPKYMAPEHARGMPTTPASDTYSVGVVVYEMLAGAPPFLGGSAVDLALSHLSEAPPPLPTGTPRSLVRVVAKALAKDPRERYADGHAMAAALVDARASVLGAEHPEPMSDEATGGVDPTRRVPRLTPRRTFNPPERRRSIALLALVLALIAGMAGAAILLSSPRRVHAIRSGPPPVKLPRLIGQSSSSATSILSSLGLGASMAPVPAPGVSPGTVTAQNPSSGIYVSEGRKVALAVAETPQWRPVTSLSGNDAGSSVPFRIRGAQWRVVYRMGFVGNCNFIFFCDGPTAHVIRVADGSTARDFGLNDGSSQTQVVKSGPGIYEIVIKPGSDTAGWSLEVEDYY